MRLVIDPTDADLIEAEDCRALNHCCICPHESYTTLSVQRSKHECFSCGEIFIDLYRQKRYAHYKGDTQY